MKTRPRPDWQDWTVLPFSPVFLCAVTFAVLVRLLEVFWFGTTPGAGLAVPWQTAVVGSLSIADLLLVCAVLFLAVAVLDALRAPRSPFGWVTVLFCLLVGMYVGGYRFLTQLLQVGRLHDFYSS